MDKKTVTAVIITAVITLIVASKVRTNIPLANKLPSL